MSVTAIPSTPAFTPASSTVVTGAAAPASSSAAASAAAPASSSAPAPVSSRPAASVAAPASSSPATARAADGDYKTRNVHTAQIKDSDGDYRPLASSVAAQSSSAVQAALTSLKAGG